MTDVTIVVPTRERTGYLRVALHSILASAAEAAVAGITTRVLVIDDASPTDATRRLCAELGVAYDRIEVHSGQANPAAAICRGVAQVDSTWFSLFGDDDVMLPRFIPLHVEALRAGADVCTSPFHFTDGRLRQRKRMNLPPARLGDLLADRITVNDGAMTTTALVRDLRWDPSLAQTVLMPVWLELLYRGARFALLEEPTFLYRRHDGNVSDRVDPVEARFRAELVAEYRARVVARDGRVPPPTPDTVPAWRRTARRVRDLVRR